MYLFCRNPRRKAAALMQIFPTIMEEEEPPLENERSGSLSQDSYITGSEQVNFNDEDEHPLNETVSAFFNWISNLFISFY